MIASLIACDHAEARRSGHLPTAQGLQSLFGFGPLAPLAHTDIAAPAGEDGSRHGRAAPSEAAAAAHGGGSAGRFEGGLGQ